MKWGIRFGEVPRALWVWVVLSAAVALVYVVVGLFEDRLLSLIGVPLTVVFTWLLLRRSRVIWTLFVVTEALSLATAPTTPVPWWSLLSGVLLTVPLLLPATWRFIWKGRGVGARKIRAELDEQPTRD